MTISSKLSTAFFFFFRQIGNLFGSLEIPYRFPLLLSLFSLSYVKSWKDVEEESDERKIASVDIRHRVALDTFFRAPRFVLCEDDEGKGKARVAILHSTEIYDRRAIDNGSSPRENISIYEHAA